MSTGTRAGLCTHCDGDGYYTPVAFRRSGAVVNCSVCNPACEPSWLVLKRRGLTVGQFRAQAGAGLRLWP